MFIVEMLLRSCLMVMMVMMIATEGEFVFRVYCLLGSVLSALLYFPVSLLQQPCGLISLIFTYR